MKGLLYIKDCIIGFWYNRSDSEMKALCEEIKNRIAKIECEHTDDGDVLYSIIILMVGEYGTSPRSGWLTHDYQKCIIEVIKDFEDMYLGGENNGDINN